MRKPRIIRIAAICLAMTIIPVFALASTTINMQTSNRFLHTSYRNCNPVDPVTKERIVIPAQYSNRFVSPEYTGAPELKGVKLSYSAEGELTTMTAANKIIKKDLGKVYSNYTDDDKYYVFNLAKAASSGTSCEFWVHNAAIYNPELTREDSPSKWELFDIKISIKPQVGTNYWTDTTESRSGRFLIIEKAINPNIAMYGPARLILKYDFYKAGTNEHYAPHTYMTIDDIDCGQGIWLRKGLSHPNGMEGPTYVAITKDTNLKFIYFTDNNAIIRQSNPEVHDDIIQDAIGIYYNSSDFSLGYGSNLNSKNNYTGAFAGFQGNAKSMADREPNKPYAWVTTESDDKSRSEARLKQYDETMYFNVQHVVASGYMDNNNFKSYYLKLKLPEGIDKDEAIKNARVTIGFGADATPSFSIYEQDGYIIAKASADALSKVSFYGKTYTLIVPAHVCDVSGCFAREDAENTLGISIGPDGGAAISTYGEVSVATKTGLKYSQTKTNPIEVSFVVPLLSARLYSPPSTSPDSRIAVKGRIFTSADENVQSIEGVSVYLSDGDRVLSTGSTPSFDTRSDDLNTVHVITSKLPVNAGITEGDNLSVCMKIVGKWIYRGKETMCEKVLSNRLALTAYKSTGENGIRYINESVSLKNSIWSSGSKRDILSQVFTRKLPISVVTMGER